MDSPRFAYGDVDGTANTILSAVPSADGGDTTASFHIQSSKTPVLLSKDNISYVETRGISHKVFTHLSYTWDRDNWVPYLGVGASAEFGKTESCDDCCDTTCPTTGCDVCVDCALSQ